METSEQERPISLGRGTMWDVPSEGTCGRPRGGEKGEEERAWGVSFVACEVLRCWLDALGTLGRFF